MHPCAGGFYMCDGRCVWRGELANADFASFVYRYVHLAVFEARESCTGSVDIVMTDGTIKSITCFENDLEHLTFPNHLSESSSHLYGPNGR